MAGKKGAKSQLSRVLPVKFEESLVSALDGRSRLGREVRERLQAMTNDLGGRGTLSHAQYSLAKRGVWLEMLLEAEELRIAAGQGVDIAPHTQLVGALLSIYKALGLKRQPKPTPSLSDYLEGRRERTLKHAEASDN